MSDQSGVDNTQKSQSGGQEPQAPDTSKIFSKGYNEGVETQEKRILGKFSEITGQEFNSIEDVYGWGKSSSQKLAESISDPTQTDEYKNLQGKFQELNQTVKSLEQEKQSIQNQYKFDSVHSQITGKLKETSEFVIPETDARDLFKARHSVEWENGSPRVKKDGQLVIDDTGNPKPLESVMTEFYKNYSKPATDGTGGGSGGGGSSKPKFADFKSASKAGNREQQAKLIQQAKSAGGWEEPDSPPVQ